MPRKATNLKTSFFSATNFSDCFKKARIAKGISLTDLAKSLGVSRNSVNLWEAGLRIPEGDAIAGICTQLGLDANQLLGLSAINSAATVKNRIDRVLKAEGKGLLASHMGINEKVLGHLLSGGLVGLSSKGLEAFADLYQLTVEWVLSGEPKHWGRSLQGEVPERLRFFRICHGIPSSVTKDLRVTQSEKGQSQITMKGAPFVDVEGMLRAFAGSAEGVTDFPFDIEWITTGSCAAAGTGPGRS